MMETEKRFGLIIAMLALASGCGTPQEIRSVASIGAKTAAVAQNESRRYIEAVNADVAANLFLLQARHLDHADYQRRVKQAGVSAEYESVVAAGKKLLKQREEREAERTAIRSRFDTIIPKMAVIDAEPYLSLQRDFSALAQELSVEQRLKLVASFFRQARAESEKLESNP